MLTNAVQLVKRSAAAALRSPPRLSLAAWSERHRVLPSEVSDSHGPWRNSLFPFLVEIMECLNPWHPAEQVTFVKSSQVGGTEMGLNWMMAVADMWPGPGLMVHPTITAGQQWVREKFSPSVRATPQARKRFVEQKSRDGSSTTLFKSFPGGFWVITGANTSVDISSKSVRYVFQEELDRWPADVDGQGDPEVLVDARQISYHRRGKAKTYRPSTPTILGVSRIWGHYLAGDQRQYHVACPHCDELQVLHFFPDKNGRGGLIFDKVPPYRARYVCAHNGCIIEHHEKSAMLRRVEDGGSARWVAGNPGPGRQPSFHINALYSPVTTWDKVVQNFLNSKDDPQKLKAFYNLWLGLPWEERGEAPDWVRLFERREEYERGRIPPGGLFVTGFVDVQEKGVYYEIVAWGRGQISWSIDIGWIEGETADESGEVWAGVEKLYRRRWPDCYGNEWEIDAFAVDSGYNTDQVYAFVRRFPKAIATKGQAGWFHPAIGVPSRKDVTSSGRRKRRGAKVWPIGTWSLKSKMYALLRKEGRRDGAEEDPPGYCHFGMFHDETFFKQLTAESLRKTEKKGRLVLEWKASGENHFHDCRVGNMALYEKLGLGQWDEARWLARAQERETGNALSGPDLVQRMIAPARASSSSAPDAPASKPSAAASIAKRLA